MRFRPRFRRRPAPSRRVAEAETVVEEGPRGDVVEEEVLEPPPPPRPLVWPWLLVLLLLVGGGLAALWLLTRDDEKSDSVVIPNVIGQSQSTAVERLNRRGLVARVATRSTDYPAGKVFAEEPGGRCQGREGLDGRDPDLARDGERPGRGRPNARHRVIGDPRGRARPSGLHRAFGTAQELGRLAEPAGRQARARRLEGAVEHLERSGFRRGAPASSATATSGDQAGERARARRHRPATRGGPAEAQLGGSQGGCGLRAVGSARGHGCLAIADARHDAEARDADPAQRLAWPGPRRATSRARRDRR